MSDQPRDGQRDGQNIDLRPACVNIRHKLMYVDERHARIGMVDDSDDTRVFFCILSQDPLGPDDEPVSPTDCTPSRSCYCGSKAAD